MNIFNEDFRNKAFKEEATAQQQSRFLTKRQIAWIVFDHFKISDTDGTVLVPLRPRGSRAQKRQSAVLGIHKWDERIILMSKYPDEETVKNLCFEQFERSEPLSQLLALYIQDTVQKATD